MNGNVYAALGGVIAVLCVLLWLEHAEAQHYQTQSAERLAAIDKAAIDNKAQAAAILELSAANEKWAAGAKVQAAAYSGALADLVRANLARAAASAALRALEAQDRAAPACAALLSTDLAAVCPTIAAGFLERAR